jgi:membrane protein implicated in regulation of membrane protease activity
MATATASRPMTAEEKKVIFASSLGTVFEWYDFYLYGSLAAIIARQFFAGLDPTSAFIFALLAFAAGFIVRPFGALVFGRLGDMIGRKYTFLVTILIMGLSTFVVGMLPTYASIGVLAPIILIVLRMLQGLALGGEYGGAATYVAEHAPQGKRGAYTSWIQTTATLGLFLSLLVILAVRNLLGEAAFADWGWRIPFLLSIALLAVSVWIRLSMNESPAFQKMKDRGQDLQGAAVRVLRPVEEPEDRAAGAVRPGGRPGGGLVHGPVLRAVLPDQRAEGGRLDRQHPDRHRAADRHAVLRGLRHAVRPHRPQADHPGGPAAGGADLLPAVQGADQRHQPRPGQAAQAANEVVVTADPRDCSFGGNPVAREIDFHTSCDIAKRYLAQHAVSYENAAGSGPATIRRLATRPSPRPPAPW